VCSRMHTRYSPFTRSADPYNPRERLTADRRRCAGKLPHVQGQAGAPPSAEEQQQDKDNIAGDGKKTSGYAAMEQPTGLAAKGATAAERAPTPGVPLLPPTPATHVIDGSWVVVVRHPSACTGRPSVLGALPRRQRVARDPQRDHAWDVLESTAARSFACHAAATICTIRTTNRSCHQPRRAADSTDPWECIPADVRKAIKL